MLGKHHSLATKKKISDSQKGRKAWNKGITHTVEAKAKIKAKRANQVFTLETRKKMADAHRGDKAWAWKGGVTPLNSLLRSSLEYKLWRKSVFERDGYSCVFGGKEHGNKLHADHIKPFSLFPELRFAIDNGRTLCVDCHRKTDTYAGKLTKKKNG